MIYDNHIIELATNEANLLSFKIKESYSTMLNLEDEFEINKSLKLDEKKINNKLVIDELKENEKLKHIERENDTMKQQIDKMIKSNNLMKEENLLFNNNLKDTTF